MTDAEILRGIAQVLRNHLDIQTPIASTTGLHSDLELDSLQQLTLVVELENHFAVCFEPGDEAGVVTVGDVMQIVRRSLVNQAEARVHA